MGRMTQTRRVLLIRHAEAGPTPAGKTDHDRPLTVYGQTQARAIGRRIAAGSLPAPQVVLASDATRALQTWAGASEGAGIAPHVVASRDFYGADPDTWMDALREVDDAVTVVALVGHAPEIPAVAHALTDATVVAWTGWPAGCVGVAEWAGDWAGFDSTARLIEVVA